MVLQTVLNSLDIFLAGLMVLKAQHQLGLGRAVSWYSEPAPIGQKMAQRRIAKCIEFIRYFLACVRGFRYQLCFRLRSSRPVVSEDASHLLRLLSTRGIWNRVEFIKHFLF